MAQRGQDYALEISDDGGTTFTKIGKLTGIDLSRERETVSTNNFDSPDDAESLATMRSWGFSGAALFVHDDAGQLLIETAYELDGTADPYTFRMTPISGVAGLQWEGLGHVTNASLTAQLNEVMEYSLDVEGTGTLTKTSVAAA